MYTCNNFSFVKKSLPYAGMTSRCFDRVIGIDAILSRLHRDVVQDYRDGKVMEKMMGLYIGRWYVVDAPKWPLQWKANGPLCGIELFLLVCSAFI